MADVIKARENVGLILRCQGFSGSKKEAGDLLEKMGVADRRPSDMSSGQRQRVGIERALARA